MPLAVTGVDGVRTLGPSPAAAGPAARSLARKAATVCSTRSYFRALAHYRLAQAYRRTGQTALAEKELETFQQLKGDTR